MKNCDKCNQPTERFYCGKLSKVSPEMYEVEDLCEKCYREFREETKTHKPIILTPL